MKIFNISRNICFVLLTSIFIVACGGGGGGSSSSSPSTGIFVDDVVEGIYYQSETSSGYTDAHGRFPFNNETVEFFVGDIKIGEITSLPSDGYVFVQDILGLSRENITNEKLINIATFLQSLDSDTTTNEIEIKKEDFDKFRNINKNIANVDIDNVLVEKGFLKKSRDEVQLHLSSSFAKYNKISFDQSEKDFLYNEFQTNYFWADKVETKSYNQYSNPNDMIDAFKYSNIDKWSYAETFEEYLNDSEQHESGFGCYFMGTPVINFIEIDSPCEKAGLKRGDVLVQIDHLDVTNESYINARENIGVEVTFSVYRDGKLIDINIIPSQYTYKSSKKYIYSTPHNKKIGYFIYNGFSSKSSDEIEDTFTHFKENQIEELIIDLRYNGGGSLAVASILLDKLAGFNNEDKLQFYLSDNQNNKISETYFMKDNNSLDLRRVFFLTSEYTASASELVINALKPYMEVIVIGNTTSGKPVGMTGKYISSKYIYWLINFAIFNANDEGEYYSGFNPTCSVFDNISEERGKLEETLLKRALSYIENENCNSNIVQSDYYTITHYGLNYKIITSPITGRKWLDRNLGATEECSESRENFSTDEEYVSSQKDCFGDYYQWGRLTDGHEKKESKTTNTRANDITLAGVSFITNKYNPDDWTENSIQDSNNIDDNGNLRNAQWTKFDGTSICPIGFRVPTSEELYTETTQYHGANDESLGIVKVINSDTAFKNFLKFPNSGYRSRQNGQIYYSGYFGVIWSSTAVDTKSKRLYFSRYLTGEELNDRGNGIPIRCIKN